ncbi:MAG: hypothetical protein CMO66_01690 [Verrucomicrobiales bacterium]|nr:hypothetical protein [Verrucomicrobiales bacterium]
MTKNKLAVTALFALGLALGLGCKSQRPGKLTTIPGLKTIVQNPNPGVPSGPSNPQGPPPGTSVPGGPTGPIVTPGVPGGNPPPVVVNPVQPPIVPSGPNQEFANFANTQPNYDFFSAHTVHFDYDSASVRPGDRGKVEAVARHMLSNPNHLLYIEGHCDERGTEQYNLSLGERRAQAVRSVLAEFGIHGERIQTISYGEKQPVVEGTDENSYQANRRGEFVLMTLPGQ